MNKPKMKIVELFSGVCMTQRGFVNSNCFDIESVATCEMDANAIIGCAAIHYGLTPEMVEDYEDYPSREEMAETLKKKRINYDFVKDKEYDWDKVARSKDSKNQLKKTWLADKLSHNLGDIMKVDKLPASGMVTFSFPCFVAGTKIRTTQGLVSIDKIEPGYHTITMGNKEYDIYNLFDNGIHKVFDLTFDDGYTVSCTYNHPFLVQRELKTEWVNAIDLMNDDKILTFNGEYRYVSSKTNSREENVYDIQVQDIHMFPLENDVCAANCTDLSLAGKQAGMEEGKTRSGLVWEVIRILKNMKNDGDKLPNFLIMENVDALINKKNLPMYQKLNAEFEEELGYKCKYQVLNTKDLSYPDVPTPQNRKRVFALYYLKNLEDRLADFKFPEPFDAGIRLKDILYDEPDIKYNVYNDKVVQMIEQLIVNGTLAEEIAATDFSKN